MPSRSTHLVWFVAQGTPAFVMNQANGHLTVSCPTPEIYLAVINVLKTIHHTPLSAAIGCVVQLLRAVHHFPEGIEVHLSENNGRIASIERNLWTKLVGHGQRPTVPVQAYLASKGARPWVAAFLALSRVQYHEVASRVGLTDNQTGIAMFTPAALSGAGIEVPSGDIFSMVKSSPRHTAPSPPCIPRSHLLLSAIFGPWGASSDYLLFIYLWLFI